MACFSRHSDRSCGFVIFSNGSLHYFWILERGNPCIITAIPTPTSVFGTVWMRRTKDFPCESDGFGHRRVGTHLVASGLKPRSPWKKNLAGQKQIKALESQRKERCRNLFDVQDEIDENREGLIEKIEGKLKSESAEEELFTIRWNLS